MAKEHKKRCLLLLIVRKLQIKITVRSHLIQIRIAIIKKSTNNKCISSGVGMEKRECFYTVGKNVNWYSHYGEQCGDSFKKLKIELLCDPTVPFLGTYWEKTIIWKDTCSPMFTAALFTVAKPWKKPKCASTDEWIKNMYNGILLSHKKCHL